MGCITFILVTFLEKPLFQLCFGVVEQNLYHLGIKFFLSSSCLSYMQYSVCKCKADCGALKEKGCFFVTSILMQNSGHPGQRINENNVFNQTLIFFCFKISIFIALEKLQIMHNYFV